MSSPVVSSAIPLNPSQLWNGRQLADAFSLAADWLDVHREHVNALNVFPVPDGDTGTNMAMTMKTAVQKIPPGELPASEVGRLLAHGALMGARGNSGVILSQIFRGFANGIEQRDEIDGQDLAKALSAAQDMAYKAVMRPVEGTMLTVIRGAAERAAVTARRTPSLIAVLQDAIEGAQHALDSTPQLLEILRQAGVVDAGGQGVVIILQGLERYALGKGATADVPIPALDPGASMAFLDHVTDLHGEDAFGYCTNFMIFGSDLDFQRVRDDIGAMGQSAVIVGDDTMIKVHIHTENPGQVLDYAIGLGSLDQIKIDNMAVQTETLAEQRAVALADDVSSEGQLAYGAISVVAVAAGDGLADALRAMGANLIVHGGQTMNPSTEDLLTAIERAPTDEVILLPNNKNIILAANQVAGLSQRAVRVVPTTSVPQALAALSSFNPDQSLDANHQAMTSALSSVISLELTRAVRNVELNGIQIATGQVIGLIDDELVVAGDDLSRVAADLFARTEADEPELITVFSGKAATEAEIAALRGVIAIAFPEAEAEFQAGGQAHYLFVISVE